MPGKPRRLLFIENFTIIFSPQECLGGGEWEMVGKGGEEQMKKPSSSNSHQENTEKKLRRTGVRCGKRGSFSGLNPWKVDQGDFTGDLCHSAHSCYHIKDSQIPSQQCVRSWILDRRDAQWICYQAWGDSRDLLGRKKESPANCPLSSTCTLWWYSLQSTFCAS